MTFIRLAAIVALVSPILAAEGEWTRFRGPNGSGISEAPRVPAKWTDRDYNWKVKLPSIRHSSPVVWGERIFATSGDPETAKRIILCLHRADGRVLWQREYLSRTYEQHRDHCYATATPAVDADGVVATWTTPEQVVLLALDLSAGTDVGTLADSVQPISPLGPGSSPSPTRSMRSRATGPTVGLPGSTWPGRKSGSFVAFSLTLMWSRRSSASARRHGKPSTIR